MTVIMGNTVLELTISCLELSDKCLTSLLLDGPGRSINNVCKTKNSCSVLTYTIVCTAQLLNRDDAACRSSTN